MGHMGTTPPTIIILQFRGNEPYYRGLDKIWGLVLGTMDHGPMGPRPWGAHGDQKEPKSCRHPDTGLPMG